MSCRGNNPLPVNLIRQLTIVRRNPHKRARERYINIHFLVGEGGGDQKIYIFPFIGALGVSQVFILRGFRRINKKITVGVHVFSVIGSPRIS
jgi:hypothetical protein